MPADEDEPNKVGRYMAVLDPGGVASIGPCRSRVMTINEVDTDSTVAVNILSVRSFVSGRLTPVRAVPQAGGAGEPEEQEYRPSHRCGNQVEGPVPGEG